MSQNFGAAVTAEQKRIVAEATEAMRSICLASHRMIIDDAKAAATYGSPVASGRFAASIRLEINAIDHSTEPADPTYRYPKGKGPRPLPPRTIHNRPISAIAAKLRSFRLGDTVYISNSVPYVRRIEIGRHSWQTPDGVFGPTVRRIVARFRNISLRIQGV